MIEKEKEKLKRTILEETDKARNELREKLNDIGVISCGCIDKLTDTKGEWNPPGGGLFIDDNGVLEGWMLRKGNGIFGIHEGCAYMFFVNRKTTLEQQQARIEEFISKVEGLNQKRGTSFKVIVEKNGSAKPYLTS